MDLIDLHFNYSLDGAGCQKAKEDFMKKVTQL